MTQLRSHLEGRCTQFPPLLTLFKETCFDHFNYIRIFLSSFDIVLGMIWGSGEAGNLLEQNVLPVMPLEPMSLIIKTKLFLRHATCHVRSLFLCIIRSTQSNRTRVFFLSLQIEQWFSQVCNFMHIIGIHQYRRENRVVIWKSRQLRFASAGSMNWA